MVINHRVRAAADNDHSSAKAVLIEVYVSQAPSIPGTRFYNQQLLPIQARQSLFPIPCFCTSTRRLSGLQPD